MTRNTNFALTLSAGALAGLMALASVSAPAFARGNGGGGGGAGGAGGGANGNVMAAVNIAAPPNPTTPPARARDTQTPCGQADGSMSLRECKYIGNSRVIRVN